MQHEKVRGTQPLMMLKKIMDKERFTQTDVAVALNVTRTTMSRKMTGKQPFKTIEIYKIIRMLNIPKEQVYDVFFSDFEKTVNMDSVWDALQAAGIMEVPESDTEKQSDETYFYGKD